MPGPLVIPYLASALVGTILSTVFSSALRSSGKHAVKEQAKEAKVSGRHQPSRRSAEREKTMSEYEIVGDRYGYSDDILGAIGANLLIGDGDDALLESLISGAGVSEIIGDSGGSAAGNPARAAVIQSIMKKGAGAVIKNQLNRRRRYPLGFIPTDVPPAVQLNIPAAPQNLFRSERLIIPSDIAFDFGVRDVKVGNQSQLAQSVEVPGAMFSEVAIDTQVTFDTAEVGNQISIDVRNKTAADTIEFTGGLMGTLAKSS